MQSLPKQGLPSRLACLDAVRALPRQVHPPNELSRTRFRCQPILGCRAIVLRGCDRPTCLPRLPFPVNE